MRNIKRLLWLAKELQAGLQELADAPRQIGRPPGVANGGAGLTIRAKREAYNALVPKASRLGFKCHVHTSNFSSHAAADKQLARIRQAVGR